MIGALDRFALASRITPRDRQVLTRGAIVIGLVLTLGRGLPASIRWQRSAHANASELSEEASRADADVAQWPATRESLQKRTTQFLALAPLIISGKTLGAATANLAATVSSAATQNNVTLGALELSADTAPPMVRSMRPSTRTGVQPPMSRPAFIRVTVRGDLTGDIHGLTRFLATLERGPMLLAIDQFALTQADPTQPPERMEVLRADFAVTGLAVTPVTPAEQKP